MTASGQNVEMHKGDDKILVVTTYDPNNVVVNITNCTLNYVVYKSNTIVINKTTASGIVITAPLSGVFEVTLVPTDTENLLGLYYHECELTDEGGHVSTLFTGKFTVLDSKA